MQSPNESTKFILDLLQNRKEILEKAIKDQYSPPLSMTKLESSDVHCDAYRAELVEINQRLKGAEQTSTPQFFPTGIPLLNLLGGLLCPPPFSTGLNSSTSAATVLLDEEKGSRSRSTASTVVL